MIKVLIVDDSKVQQHCMSKILTSDTDIEIVGVASSSDEAIDLVFEKRPDVITMDIHLQGMDGYEATRIIMEAAPTPIVIVSGHLRINDKGYSFRLFEAGALSIVLRPPWMEDSGFDDARKILIQTVRLMSEVKVVRRFPKQSKDQIQLSKKRLPICPANNEIQLIAIGASTGGPVALQTILSNLPQEFSVPVLIVQHIAKGFVKGFRDWLACSTLLHISIAVDGEMIKPGNCYISPDGFHMGIIPGPRIKLSDLPYENGLRPSVDFLFRSVAEVMGPKAVGVLLSGMGKDGAKGLKTMKDRGAITIVQNEESCVVNGMPGEAVRISAAVHVLPPEKMSEFLTDIFKEKKAL